MRLGLMLAMPGDPAGTRELIQRAQAAERAGLDAAWLPQVFGLDALTVLALVAAETSRLRLGTAVVPTYPRHPTALASQAMTVQEASGGRLMLGIGLSHRFVIEGVLGMDYSRPIAHMREYLAVLNGLLSGNPVAFEGDLYRVKGSVTVPGVPPPPVYVAALGPQMLKLCGMMSAGTITWAANLPFLRDIAVPTLAEAARHAGRPPAEVVAMVPVALATDAAAAREIAGSVFAGYAQVPSYKATLERGGASGMGETAIVGDERAIAEGLTALFAAGVTQVNAVAIDAPGGSRAATLELLGRLARSS